ncbi:hypothetical protein C4577_03200 [Candidatus Parcubacteria bacterium]|nr:MAG: hypothetical protein C4577_03200 [Candidatus Parcubacteria bacterium]
MYYVYILQSLKDNKTYVGYTDNFERRFEQHNSGRSKSTKHRSPWFLKTSNSALQSKIF